MDGVRRRVFGASFLKRDPDGQWKAAHGWGGSLEQTINVPFSQHMSEGYLHSTIRCACGHAFSREHQPEIRGELGP